MGCNIAKHLSRALGRFYFGDDDRYPWAPLGVVTDLEQIHDIFATKNEIAMLL